MNLLAEAMSGFGAVLLPVAAALLLEELTFGGLVRLLLAPRPGDRRNDKGAANTGKRRRRREMLALKMLLTVAGVLLLAAALGIPLYGLWLRIQYALKKKAARKVLEVETLEPEPDEIAWRGRWRWRWWHACRC